MKKISIFDLMNNNGDQDQLSIVLGLKKWLRQYLEEK